MIEPRAIATKIESQARLPAGGDERFSGYGVMGLPFASGHVLALRRFPASSVGPGFTSVWHRDPAGRWAFYADAEPRCACNRYFGAAIADTQVAPIRLDWTGPRRLAVTVGDDALRWEVHLAPTIATRAMTAIGRRVPAGLWRSAPVLVMMGAVAGPVLRAGTLRLQGRVPNGQRFEVSPRLVWAIPASTAAVRGEDLGPVGSLPEQARLGDFWLPQRGLFAVGEAFLQPVDPARLPMIAAEAAAPAT